MFDGNLNKNKSRFRVMERCSNAENTNTGRLYAMEMVRIGVAVERYCYNRIPFEVRRKPCVLIGIVYMV